MRAILYPSEISGRVAAAVQKHGTPCAHLRGAGQRRKPRVEPFRLAGYHGNACRHAPAGCVRGGYGRAGVQARRRGGLCPLER